MGFLKWLFGSNGPAPDPRKQEPAPPAPDLPSQSAAPAPAAPAPSLEDMRAKMKAMLESMKGERKRLLIYAFQHRAIKDAALNGEPHFLHDLRPDADARFHRCLSVAKQICIERAAQDPTATLDPTVMDDHREMLASIKVAAHRRGGFTLHLITFPEPQEAAELYFAGVVYKDGEHGRPFDPAPSNRFFTLEKSQMGDQPFFCEWTFSTHSNMGQLPAVNADEFVESVFQRVLPKA